ncbi:hypothetical protein FORC065_0813 [Yersinia enterocolitica]|nr:hypothetical protein FORC065_0813 [Yersinia enterocolitica]
MNPDCKAITDFYLEQYNYKVSLEGSQLSNILTGSLIEDFNCVISGQSSKLHNKIIETIKLNVNKVNFSAAESMILINSGVSKNY